MSADRGEPDPQEWPTYPGVPVDPDQPPAQPQQRTPPPADRPRPHSEPDPVADEAFQAYQNYAQGQPEWQHQQAQPYHQAPYQQQPPRDTHTAWLQNKWMWIIGGILAVFVITALAQGNFPWVPLIFGIVVWNIFRHNRRQG